MNFFFFFPETNRKKADTTVVTWVWIIVSRARLHPTSTAEAGAFPLRVDKAAYRFGIELAFALKIAVEAASRQPRAGHDVIDRDGRETVAIKELCRALDDSLPDLVPIARRIGHLIPAPVLNCH